MQANTLLKTSFADASELLDEEFDNFGVKTSLPRQPARKYLMLCTDDITWEDRMDDPDVLCETHE